MKLDAKQQNRLIAFAEIADKGPQAVYEKLLELDDTVTEAVAKADIAVETASKIIAPVIDYPYIIEKVKVSLPIITPSTTVIEKTTPINYRQIIDSVLSKIPVLSSKTAEINYDLIISKVLSEIGPIKNGEPGANGSPDTPEQVRDKLETLKGNDRLDKSAIKGLIEDLARIEKQLSTQISRASVAGRDIFKDIDISAQFNGILKTFNIPATYNIISVNLSSFPYGSLRKTIDFTYTPTTITFTSAITASTQLAAGQSCILTTVTG